MSPLGLSALPLVMVMITIKTVKGGRNAGALNTFSDARHSTKVQGKTDNDRMIEFWVNKVLCIRLLSIGACDRLCLKLRLQSRCPLKVFYFNLYFSSKLILPVFCCLHILFNIPLKAFACSSVL